MISAPPGFSRTLNIRRPRPGRQADRPLDLLRQAAENIARPAQRGRVRLWHTHNWDPDTSGLVVFARDPEAAKTIRASMRGTKGDHVITAVVHGFLEGAGTHRSTLVRRDDRSVSLPPQAFTGELDDEERPLAKAAVTHYRAVRSEADLATVIQIREETGVREQARAHLSEAGHAVINDGLYGGKRPTGPLAMHTTTVAFIHPGSNMSVRYTDTLPPFMRPEQLVGSGRDNDRPDRADAQRNEDAHASQQPSQQTTQQPNRQQPQQQTDFPAVEAKPVGDQTASDQAGWEHVADWYSGYRSSAKSDLFTEVIGPGTLRLLGNVEGKRVLDIACGEGGFAHDLAERGATVCGVDASPSLIERAQESSSDSESQIAPEFRVLDAMSDPAQSEDLGSFDVISCVMALMNIENANAVFRLAAARLEPGGSLVAVTLHPAFRQPGRTGWVWTDQGVQRRAVDAYLSDYHHQVVMNPGGVANKGEQPVTTTSITRPIGKLLNACSAAGLLIERVEEWASSRKSQPGPRAEAENTARSEIPMFLAWRARLVTPTNNA